MLQSKQRLLELNAKLAETLISKGVTATADETTTALIDKVKNISGSDKLVEFSQVRPEVQDYLDNVTYDPTDNTTSQIADYVTDTSNNYPVGCTVNLQSAGTLVVCDSANGGSTVTNSVAGDNYIYNLTPNAICTYVNIVDGNIEQSGTVKATGQMRMIKSGESWNVRDLGGWNCDGGTVKYGKLFRGGEVSLNDRPVLVDYLGIKNEINLRGTNEANWTVSPMGNDINFFIYNSYPWYSISNGELLKQILTDIFNCVLNDEPTYFHCWAGADRTGTIAFILETILGVSQSDMDKDYELTCFFYGVDSDENARRRNEDEWSGLANSFSDYAGDTIRDKAVNWLLSLGFSIDTINDFRSKMIDGTPEILSFSGEIYTVSNNLENTTVDNEKTSIEQYASYIADVTPADGYVISNISVLMGGKDITDKVFSGTKTNLNYAVKNTLANCTSNNSRIAVINGQSYGALITADTGYTLDGAEVSIKMGGIDVSEFYSDGKIIIPVVTGNIEINITAQENAPTYTNMILTSTDADGNVVGLIENMRYNSSDILVESTSVKQGIEKSINACGFIAVKAGDVIRFKNMLFGNPASSTYYIRLYDTDKTELYKVHPSTIKTDGYPTTNTFMDNIIYDSDNNITQFTVKKDTICFLRMAWGSDTDEPAIITVNEEMN